MQHIFAIVLAAGQGKRMKSHIPKVAHLLHKKTLLQWTIDALLKADIAHIMVVISRSQELENILNIHYKEVDVRFCYQDKPLGTANAVQCGMQALEKPRALEQKSLPRPYSDKDTILIAYGDTPAVKSQTYKKLLQFHSQEQNAITIIAFNATHPFGYGRVVLNAQNEFLEIREEKDCSEQEKQIRLCHSGIMCANFEVLNEILPQINNQNQASEFYLTDVIRVAKSLGHKVGFIASDHEHEFLGINTPEQLVSLESLLCAV